MDNLEIVQQDIIDCNNQISMLFKSLNNPSNILLKKDRNWGKQNVQLYLRLDEVSVEALEKLLPSLKALLTQFHALRRNEADITDATDMRNAINPMAPEYQRD